MPRFFLHLRDGTDVALDDEGSEHFDLDALKVAMLTEARDCIAGDVKKGIIDLRLRIDAEDAAGTVAHSLPFSQAFELISGDGQ